MNRPIVTIARDPFARSETVRQTVTKGQECSWCGSPARFRYGVHQDGLMTRPSFGSRAFCGRSCERSYNS